MRRLVRVMVLTAVAILGAWVVASVGWYICYPLLLPNGMLLTCLIADERGKSTEEIFLFPLTRRICLNRFERIGTFPAQDYSPNTPIGAAVAMFDYYPVSLDLERRVITYMKSRGSDVNAYDEQGFTPLLGEVIGNRPESVSLLLELGADPKLVVKPRPGHSRSYDGLDATAFARWFADNGKESRARIVTLLAEPPASGKPQ